MMKFTRVLKFSLFLLLPLFFGACKNNLVQETTHDYNEKKNAADYADYILPPTAVTASKGDARCVKLSWTPVENAVRYQIFSAETPFDTFKKVLETKGVENEVMIDEFSGVTKYYSVCAVNYFGTVSTQSSITEGATLAVPIITEIEASEEGNSVTLSWWMDNCSPSTYENDISFNVYVYKAGASSVALQKIPVRSDCRLITIDGLSSMTEYEFVVEAERIDQSAKETGAKTTAETAHRIIPDAPLDFTVMQGESAEAVSISWLLPSGSWYKDNAGESGFVLHPLYFKIYRKEADSHNDYEELFSIGAQRDNPSTWRFDAKQDLFFNCNTCACVNKNGDDASQILMVEVPLEPAADLAAPSEPYNSYIPGSKLIFNDLTAVRGKKYSYYIQSFTDDIPAGKNVTADSCLTQAAEGWKIAAGIFSISAEYNLSQEDAEKFESVFFNCDFNFTDNDVLYSYVIEQTKLELDDTEELNPVSSFIKKYTSLEELKTEKLEFSAPGTQAGYYRYKLYLCPFELTEIEEAETSAYTSFTASGKYLVTDDATKVPKIENFTLVDGYKNGYMLSWKYNPDYSYLIHYRNIDLDGTLEDEETVEEINTDELIKNDPDDETVFLFHHAESGDRRTYKLEATVGLSKSVYPNGDTADKIYSTLGTPEPQISVFDYDKISVSWPAVQRVADDVSSYQVTAVYEDDISAQNIVTDENTSLVLENNKVICVINCPPGYDDAAVSGKAIKLTVRAKSETTEDFSEAQLPVSTLGPALTNAQFGAVQFDRINLNWNKVNGAQGYLIRRVHYEDGKALLLADSADTYYFDGEKLYANSEEVKPERASVTLNQNLFTLSDKYLENTGDDSSYARNQTMISWGIPFGYIVIPVKADGQEDFEFDGKNVLFAQATDLAYKNISEIEKIGATPGYGLGVHAQKSMDGQKQKVTWNAPYYAEETVSVYYRAAGQTANWKKVNKNFKLAENRESATFEPETIDGAYEYMVAYKKEAAEINDSAIPVSFINDKTGMGLSSPETEYNYTALGLTAEKANKGYLLAIKFDAETGNRFDDKVDYSERVWWNEWDYENRSIGPESAVISVRNYNISADWNPVANLGSDLHYDEKNLVANLDGKNTKVEKSNSGSLEIFVSPISLMDGSSGNYITNGLLQVLRDAKHYYSITLKRGDVEAELGSEGEVYAFRNINDYEFAKMVMLAYSDGISKIGNLDFDDGTREWKDSLGGKVTAKHESRISDKYIYSFDNYRPKMESPAGNLYVDIKISADGNVYRHSTVAGSYPVKFDNVTINVAASDANMPDSYKNRSVNFSLEIDTKLDWFTYVFKSISGNISVNNSSITSLDTKDKCRVYVPCRLWYEETDYYKNNTFGWWPN